MSANYGRLDKFPHGALTLVTTFLFVLFFRIEQNVAYLLGLPSARRLVGLDSFAVELPLYALAPFVHVTPNHLVGTLVLFVPFGYLLERRTSGAEYVGFVVLAGYLTTTFVPLLFLLAGAPVGQGIGASGLTNALVAREAAVRGRWVVQRRSLSRRQWTVVVLVSAVFLIEVVGLVTGEPPGTSVVGHAVGLVVGVLTGVGEGYVSLTDD